MQNWDDLRVILALARAGTSLAAARRLGITHSTVLRRLDAAEARLGVRLFDRHPRGLAPTPSGERLAEAATRMEAEQLEAVRAVAGGDLRAEGTVRITAPDTLFELLVLPVLAGLRRTHPAIHFEVVLSNPEASLTRREADIAVRPTRAPPETAVGRRIADVAVAVYGIATAAAAPRDWTASAATWVAPDESLDRYPVTGWMRGRVPAERVVLRANSVRAMADAAASGLGFAALPCFLGDATTGLMRLSEPIDALSSPLWLLTHADLKDAARIRVVMEALGAGLAAAAPRIEGRDTD